MKTKLFLRSGGADENLTFSEMHTFVKMPGAKERMKTKLFSENSKNPATLDLQRKGAEERLKTKLFNF